MASGLVPLSVSVQVSIYDADLIFLFGGPGGLAKLSVQHAVLFLLLEVHQRWGFDHAKLSVQHADVGNRLAPVYNFPRLKNIE